MKAKQVCAVLILLIGVAVSGRAQELTGRVVDDAKRPMEYVNVVAYALPDSAFVAGAITDANGAFSLPTNGTATKRVLKVSFVGYETQVVEAQPGIVITLRPEAAALGEVTVTADRIRRSAGGYTANLLGSTVTQGRQTDEILAMLPGVTRREGVLQVLGQAVGTIYVDGIRLTDTKELAALPADRIRRVQVDYTPGSSEFASTRGAVIRITLRKELDGGYYGYAMAGADVMPKYGFSRDFAYAVYNGRFNRLSLYNVFSYTNHNLISDDENTYSFLRTGREIRTEGQYRGWTHGLYDRLSLTYDLTPRNTLGTSLYFSTDHATPRNDVATLKPRIPSGWSDTALYCTLTETPYTYRTYQATLRFDRELDDQGSTFNIGADYLRQFTRNRMQTVRTLPALAPDTLSNRSEETTNMLEARTSLNKNFASGLAIHGGLAYRRITVDYDLTNERHLRTLPYAEGQMPAAYVEVQGPIGKRLQYGVGLRVQENRIAYRPDAATNLTVHDDWDAYSSFNLLWMINEARKISATLAYTEAVDDIPYSALTTYREYGGEHSYTTGNPDLVSPKSHTLTAVLDLFDHLSFNTIYIYNETPIYYATRMDPALPSVTYTKPMNAKYERLFGLNAEARFDPLPWWKLRGMVMYTLFGSKSEDFDVHSQQKYYFSLSNTFRFTPHMGASLEGYYEPTYHFTDRIYRTVYEMSGSVYHTFLRDRLALRLNFKLFRHGRVIDTETPDLRFVEANRTRDQYFGLSLSYSFSGGRSVNVKQTEEIQSYEKIRDKR